MNEQKQLMLAGMLFQPSDDELSAERRTARSLTAAFNRFDVDEVEQRVILEQLLGKLGRESWIRPMFRCDYGYNIVIGDRAFLNYDCTILDCAPVTIGNDVNVATGVQLITVSHPLDADARRNGAEIGAPVVIEDNAWVGSGTLILPGVTVGTDSIIGAGSVVTHDVPAGVVAAGNPCKVLRSV